MRAAGLGLLLVSALGACGVAYAPGDFLAHDTTTTPDSGAIIDAAITTPTEASTPDAAPSETRIMLFGSNRAPLPGATALTSFPLTMLTTLTTTGVLGAWTFDEPPPIGGDWTRAVIENDTIYLEGATLLSEASFKGNAIASPWTSATLSNPASDQHHGWLVDSHAFHESSANNLTQYSAPIYDDAGVGPWAATGTAETVQRIDETLIRAGNFVYAIGGLGGTRPGPINNGASPDVEVATYDPASGTLGAFTPLDSLYAGDAGSVGDAGAVFGIYLPVVAAGGGHIVIAGGVVDKSGSTYSNVVLATRAEPTTGALEPWASLPPLPAAIAGFGLVVTNEWIVVIGGIEANNALHNEVWGLTIGADGTYGTAWTQLGAMPGPRSGLTAVTY